MFFNAYAVDAQRQRNRRMKRPDNCPKKAQKFKGRAALFRGSIEPRTWVHAEDFSAFLWPKGLDPDP
jgi:hypothetical protein